MMIDYSITIFILRISRRFDTSLVEVTVFSSMPAMQVNIVKHINRGLMAYLVLTKEIRYKL